jgi:hypothetical protein
MVRVEHRCRRSDLTVSQHARLGAPAPAGALEEGLVQQVLALAEE